jgi:ankyrin repeat protein
MTKQNRQNKREAERQRVTYCIQTGQKLQTIVLNNDLFEMYCGYIDKNATARFGIVKLSNVDLNYVGDGGFTLLEYASWKKRDAIVLALIRAGANPTISLAHPAGCHESQDIMAFLWKLQPSYCVWVVNFACTMRKGSFSSTCGKCFSDTQVFKLPCGDLICEVCFWNALSNSSPYRDLDCSICSNSLNQQDYLEFDKLKLCLGQASKSINEESKQKFDELAVNVDIKGTKRMGFKARTMYQLNRLFIGISQEVRASQFLDAASDGNHYRLLAIVEQGIDLNVRNEYGQTAYFLAVWKKHEDCMDFLRFCGCDENIPDNTGLLPQDIHHENVTDELGTLELNRLSTTVKVLPNTFGPTYVFDNCLTFAELEFILKLHQRVPTAAAKKVSCSDRSYYCDSRKFVTRVITRALKEANLTGLVMPQMRFLDYKHAGGYLPPHIDLARVDEQGIRSTHTFILYLTCSSDEGGETGIMEALPTNTNPSPCIVHKVFPKQSRLFVFPHITPHYGGLTTTRKLLLRGEVYLQAVPDSEYF